MHSSFVRGVEGRRVRRSAVLLAACMLYGASHAQGVPRVPAQPVAPPKPAEVPVAPEPGGAALFASRVGSVVLIQCTDAKGQGGTGAGSVITRQGSQGMILTNVHVVRGAKSCFVVPRPRGTPAARVPLQIVALDPSKDLAVGVVKSLPDYATPIPMGSLDEVAVGQDVHAIGHPLGLSWSYTKGTVSSIRHWKDNDLDADVIQTQTPISPGNSGGPLMSNAGRLVGVNTFVWGGGAGAGQNLNFAISINEVQAFLVRVGNGQHKPDAGPGSAPEQEAKKKDCEFKEHREASSKGIPGKLVFGDLMCAGWDNAALLLPQDPERELIFYVSTRRPAPGEETRYDMRFYLDAKTRKVLRSLHDVDGDGKPDYLGIHKDGSPEPIAFEVLSSGAVPLN